MRATRHHPIAVAGRLWIGAVLIGLIVGERLHGQESSAAGSSESKKQDSSESRGTVRTKGRVSEEPTVRTQAEVEKRRRSPFQSPPGSNDHDDVYDAEDLRDSPPWSRASFFGVPARGRFFIYVLDQSGSMIDDDRLTRAVIELRRSVNALQSPQRFEVFFYNEESTTMPGGPTARSADHRNKVRLANWLRFIEPEGGTNPLQAVKQAVALRPDAVFLLSDGDFPPEAASAIALANTRKVPIHCIDLAGGETGQELKTIASQSGGRYVLRPGSLHHVGAGR